MNYLDVVQKVQKVYNSCETVEQTEVGKKYVMLLVDEWFVQKIMSGTGSINQWIDAKRRRESLIEDCKELRLAQIDVLTKQNKMINLPELVFHHPV